MEYQYCCYYLILLAGLMRYCVIAFDWPEGHYGLPMANTGCPSGAIFGWKSGWIYQDTENYNPRNSKSTSFHLDGEVLPSSVNRSFCMKTQITNDHQRPLWPAGKYCIYQRTNNCPVGFNSGFISWDDENDNNKNKRKGTLPKVGSIYSDTTIYFCCRDDGDETNPIDLPTGSPFYLFAHTSQLCQQVKWTLATTEWILYDTEDTNNQDYVSGSAPYVEEIGAYGKIKIFYCYYTSCQYTRNASHGMITFPASGNYENGQLCSWSIAVQASQTIRVHFSRFQLSGDVNDQLIFYDGKDDSAPRLATLHGGYTLHDITSRFVIQSSSSNLFVVFRSSPTNTAAGFEADYTAIGTPLTFPPPISTTSIETTTSIKTTTSIESTTSIETTTATEAQVVSEKTNPTEIALSSSNPPSKPSSEPSSLPKGNFSKNYDTLKKTCIQQSQSTLTAVAIVIPLICIIAVIVMGVYFFFRLRTLPKKPSDVSVRYTTSPTAESVNNPAYVPSDAVIEASPPRPSTNNAYEDSKGDIYHEIEPSKQATDNPLYQSTDEDKHVYASFA